MGGDNFQKGDDFRKAGPPDCAKCGMMTNDNVVSNIRGAYAWCERCSHEVDKEGRCVATERCVACSGRPECSRCGRITDESSDKDYRFRCNNCNHRVDNDGDCREEVCLTCNPYRCSTCGSKLSGDLDEDGEIHCDECEHYVDSEGDCVTTSRTHCDTCDSYPDCPACDASTNHEDSDDDDDSGDYYCEDECSHTLDCDGDCRRVSDGQSCTDCDVTCSTCDTFECWNDPCDWDRDGECRHCHCHDEDDDDDIPDCPDCGDNEDVEGPDGDGDYWCTYEDCDSGNYFN